MMNVLIGVYDWGWIVGCLAGAAVFAMLASVRRLRRLVLSAAMTSMIAATLLSAAYVIAYERSYGQRAEAACQAKKSERTLRQTGAAVRKGPDRDAGRSGSQAQQRQDAGGDDSLVATCIGNAIMRASLHVQVAVAVGGLFAAGMGIVAAFATIMSVLDGGDRDRSVAAGKLEAAERGGEEKNAEEPPPSHRPNSLDWFTLAVAGGLLIEGARSRRRRRL